MALLASTLITAAKQRAFGAIGSQKISNASLLGELSHQDMLVVQLLSQTAPDLLATVGGLITFTDAGNLNGYALFAGMHYRDFTHIDPDTDKPVPINILQRQHRDSGVSDPAAMIRTNPAGAVFYPIDPANKRWAGGDTSSWFEPDKSHTGTYSYVKTPEALTTLSGTLSSPDMAREVFVTALEVRILLSGKMTEEKQAKLQIAVTALQAAQASLTIQAYRFAQPQGQPANDGGFVSDASWVGEQVGN